MEKETKVAMTDYNEVLTETVENILGRLTYAEDGAILDVFPSGMEDPWQLFIQFGAIEAVLRQYRTDKRCKTVYVQVQPEGLVGAEDLVTPMGVLMQHVAYRRLEDVQAGRLEFGEITYDGQHLTYEGNADLKGRHVVLITDLAEIDPNYLEECMALCREMKANHVVALPMMMDEEQPAVDKKIN